MDEWTVVVCKSGYYGKECKQQCSINCNVTTQCNKVTGQCEGGCKPGWTGNTCDHSMNIWLLYLKRRRNFIFYIQLKLLLKSSFFFHFLWKNEVLFYFLNLLLNNTIFEQYKQSIQAYTTTKHTTEISDHCIQINCSSVIHLHDFI